MASASVDLPESPVNESCEEDVSLDDSIYVPTPERHLQIKLNRVESLKVAFMDTAELDRFITVKYGGARHPIVREN